MDISLDYSNSSIGKYRLVRKLGNGGFGAVYVAFDSVLRVEKAIKILEVTNPKEAHKLFTEAAIPYKCKHPHIININGGELFNFNGEKVFVIDMDLVNGSSVDYLLKNQYISIQYSLNIIKNILFAVEYSHLQNIIHRDIKPANILLDNAVPKLADFGLATALGSLIIPWRWYRTHAAPETFDDESIATVETDIFALGMTLYRMVNGIADWDSFLCNIPNREVLIHSGKLISVLPFHPIVPQKICRIIKKACHKDPSKRFHSASEMRNKIECLNYKYDWNCINPHSWIGKHREAPTKEIYLEKTRNSNKIVIKNNGRRSCQDSRQFATEKEAVTYMHEYINGNTFY